MHQFTQICSYTGFYSGVFTACSYVANILGYMQVATVGVNKRATYQNSNYDRITIVTQLYYAS